MNEEATRGGHDLADASTGLASHVLSLATRVLLDFVGTCSDLRAKAWLSLVFGPTFPGL